tara:strand:+ start:170 stop:406 length:237 start_codon:yes stop_codon:yes gene_type:complete
MNKHRMLLTTPELPEEGACVDITWHLKKGYIVVEKMDIYFIINYMFGNNVTNNIDSVSYTMLLQAAVNELRENKNKLT